MTNHAKDAELWIENAVTAQSTRKDDAGAAINASIAQAHATLAVVQAIEQASAALMAAAAAVMTPAQVSTLIAALESRSKVTPI